MSPSQGKEPHHEVLINSLVDLNLSELIEQQNREKKLIIKKVSSRHDVVDSFQKVFALINSPITTQWGPNELVSKI